MTILLLVVIGLPALGALALALAPRVGDQLAAEWGVLVSAGALAGTVVLALGFDRGDSGRMQFVTDASWIAPINVRGHFGIDGISLPLLLLTALLSVLCFVSLLRNAPSCGGTRGLVVLLLLLETGVLGTFSALDLVLFFVFFETVLIPMWWVIADWGDPHDIPGNRRAATVFLLMTVTGSAVMLVGFLLVYAHTGTFDMVALAERGGAGIPAVTQLVAALAIGLGLAVKTPMWPLHIWLPDAHAKAPTVGSVLLAGVLLKMGTYGFVRIWLPTVPDGVERVAPFLGAFGAIAVVYGALACLAQTDLKRLIAYSSVGHMGFVLLGISTLTTVGINGALFANVAHGLITGLLFFCVGGLKDRAGSSDFADLGRGLYGRTPRLAGVVAFACVASLGLPGLAGFWGEMLSMLGAFDPGGALARGVFVTLMAVAGAGTILTAAYFLGLLRRLGQGLPSGPHLDDIRADEVLTWSPLVALTVVFGLAPGLILGLTNPAVQVLMGGGG
jgi:NADH-quinone oxidoreductase subunit M